MKARLGFSIALNVDAEILLVDEILSVGDKQFRKKSYDSFVEFKKSGKTILIATHNLETLPEICDKAILLNYGKMVKIGHPDDILEEYQKLRSSK